MRKDGLDSYDKKCRRDRSKTRLLFLKADGIKMSSRRRSNTREESYRDINFSNAA